MNFGFPIATIRISACLHNSFKFFVLECAMVTVAFSRSISNAIGFPTMLLLPITTQCFPSISIFERFNNWIIPAGVQDKKPGSPIVIAPTLCGWKPSTSFFGEIAWMILSSSMCFGTGSCTKIPQTSSLLFRSSMISKSSASVVSSGNS